MGGELLLKLLQFSTVLPGNDEGSTVATGDSGYVGLYSHEKQTGLV